VQWALAFAHQSLHLVIPEPTGLASCSIEFYMGGDFVLWQEGMCCCVGKHRAYLAPRHPPALGPNVMIT